MIDEPIDLWCSINAHVRLVFAGLVWMTFNFPAGAQDASLAPAEPKQFPIKEDSGDAPVPKSPIHEITSRKVLRAVADFYASASSFEVEYAHTLQLQSESEIQPRGESIRSEISALRPNRLVVRPKDDPWGPLLASDGKQLFITVGSDGQYVKSVAPRAFDHLLTNHQFLEWRANATAFPLLELFALDPMKEIMEGVTSTRYCGKEVVDEQLAHHLELKRETVWELWVAATGDPLVCQMSVELSDQKGPLLLGGVFKAKWIHSYRNWRIGVDPPLDAFDFHPPPAKTPRRIMENELQKLREKAANSVYPVTERLDRRISAIEKILERLPVND